MHAAATTAKPAARRLKDPWGMTTVPKPTAITATAATMRRPWLQIRSDRAPPCRRKRRKSPSAKTAPPSPKTTSAGAAGSRGQANTPQAAAAAPTSTITWALPRSIGPIRVHAA